MKAITKEEISELIYTKILSEKEAIKECFEKSKNGIGYFFVDNLLPEELAHACYNVFPKPSEMRSLNSIREYKYVSAQMDKHNKLLEDVIYAFQSKKIVNVIGDICGISSMLPDESLYAGGLSLMAKDNFLNPHLDNSHGVERKLWRVLNLLYYVSPNWESENGGHLEIWPNGLTEDPIIIESKFNRLAVMATHSSSWHSVSKVKVYESRCCISNYYFSEYPLKQEDRFHVTSYRGRPDEKIKNIVLGLDNKLRMFVRKVFKTGIRKNPHIYKNKH